jgi:hypothetical protein
LELRYIVKNNETFSNLSVAIVSQKYQEFSIEKTSYRLPNNFPDFASFA